MFKKTVNYLKPPRNKLARAFGCILSIGHLSRDVPQFSQLMRKHTMTFTQCNASARSLIAGFVYDVQENQSKTRTDGVRTPDRKFNNSYFSFAIFDINAWSALFAGK